MFEGLARIWFPERNVALCLYQCISSIWFSVDDRNVWTWGIVLSESCIYRTIGFKYYYPFSVMCTCCVALQKKPWHQKKFVQGVKKTPGVYVEEWISNISCGYMKETDPFGNQDVKDSSVNAAFSIVYIQFPLIFGVGWKANINNTFIHIFFRLFPCTAQLLW